MMLRAAHGISFEKESYRAKYTQVGRASRNRPTISSDEPKK
jgi:hypothetical protein